MGNNKQKEFDSNLHNKVCPYLGTRDDGSSYFSYPSPGNHCYRVKPNQSISLPHQENTCLSENFNQCQIFSSAWEGPLPSDIQGVSNSKIFNFNKQTLLVFTVAALIIAVSFIFVVFRNILPSRLPSQIAASPTLIVPTLTPVITDFQSTKSGIQVSPTTSKGSAEILPSATIIENTPSPLPSATATQIPSETPTPTSLFPTAGPALETAFGPDNRYIIHSVQEGEFFGKIAQDYNTSVEVISAANNLIEGANLWVGTLLVILPGINEPVDIPKFEIVFVEKQSTITEISEAYSVPKDELIFYNSLGTIEDIPAGRWIIFPIENK